MLNSGFKNYPSLVESDNSSVIVVMSKPQFNSHRHKPKFRANNRKHFKKPDESNNFIIQMNVNFLFLSSYDYEKLSQTNALKNYPLWNSPWRDINKNYAFRIPDNFISQSKILKLTGLVTHHNLEPAVKDLMNQGQLIEELQKLLFAILSKMHNRKQTTSTKEINNANSFPPFKSEKSKLEKNKKPVYVSEAKDFLEVNLKEKRKLSPNFAVQDSHKNYDDISISTYDSDKGKKIQKIWHEDKTESLDEHGSHKVTKQGISRSFAEVTENNGTKVREIQDFQSDSRMAKDHVEFKKVSKDDSSDFNHDSNNRPYHFSITESFENSSHAAIEINLKKYDNKNISKKSNTRRRKPLIYPINENSQNNKSIEKLLLTENELNKSQQLHELKGSDNASDKETKLEKPSIRVNPNLFLPRIEYASYDAVNMSSSKLFSNHTYPQLKGDIGQSRGSNNGTKKIWTKMNEKNPKTTIVEKAGEFKQLEKAVIQDNRRKYNEGGNLNTIELVERQESPTETKELIAEELARIFSPDIESDKKSVKHDNVLHNSVTLHNEIRNLDPEASKHIENEHETMKKAQYLIKDSRNATTSDFTRELHTIQGNNYTLNEVIRIRRSLHNSNDTSKKESEPHFGGAYHLKLNESENLLHREKRQIGAIIPHNHWCPIQVMRRNGNVDCTIWTHTKICKLECHPGFTHSGKEEVTSQCSRRKGGQWSIDINARCRASDNEKDPYYRSADKQDGPKYRSEDSKPVAKPVTKAAKEPNSVSERNSGSKKEPEKSNDKKASPPKESKSAGGSAENAEDDEYYENYDYPEK